MGEWRESSEVKEGFLQLIPLTRLGICRYTVEARFKLAFLSLFENELTLKGTRIDKSGSYALALRMKKPILFH
jgi:hypothetical protein